MESNTTSERGSWFFRYRGNKQRGKILAARQELDQSIS